MIPSPKVKARWQAASNNSTSVHGMEIIKTDGLESAREGSSLTNAITFNVPGGGGQRN